MLLFHGTTLKAYRSIEKQIDVYYNADNETDFGYGFYLGGEVYARQTAYAKCSVARRTAGSNEGDCIPILLAFEVDEEAILRDRLIKEGIDEQGRKLAVRERAWYAKVKDEGFTNIPKIYATEPLIMERIDGRNIFEYELSLEEKKKVLGQLVGCLRRLHEMDGCEADESSYYEEYIGKTFDRLSKVRGLVPFADDEYVTINGIRCRNVFLLQEGA